MATDEKVGTISGNENPKQNGPSHCYRSNLYSLREQNCKFVAAKKSVQMLRINEKNRKQS
ncbi:hypothetical protein C7B76_25535 [filamentous cyanobacterium CCP2]|nr:hypothetical protein C7B76_25535 [filamentous cyanobacterium CCP2]